MTIKVGDRIITTVLRVREDGLVALDLNRIGSLWYKPDRLELSQPDPQAALEAAARKVVDYSYLSPDEDRIAALRSALAALDESRKT